MKFSLPIPTLVAEASSQVRFRRARIPAPVDLIIEILIFVAVFIIAGLILENLAYTVITMPLLFANESYQDLVQSGGIADFQAAAAVSSQVTSTPLGSAFMLFATIGCIIGVIIYCRFIERRKFRTMGFRRGHILREYFVGLLVGLVLFSAAVLVAMVTGTMHYAGLAGSSATLVLLFLLGFMIQGMSEELLCRGYFMVSLARRQHVAVAIIVSSCFFGLLHIFNSNITLLAIVNIALFGVFMGIYMLKRGNIWGVGAIHTAWNFTQGNIFGISVSGMERQPSIFIFEPNTTGELISGGAFGIEGGLAATLVLVVAVVIGLLMKCKDPAPLVFAGNDGSSQVVVLPGAQQLPLQPTAPEYWQPPTTQGLPGGGDGLPPQQGNWPPPGN
ncbi:MAG: CPBP family intramembrane metalloprotease [Coriobacteriia bacterium]|nr:CPBP family intramembrane metalloprotease [Coriobacteriia bacterium]